jgi:hypothetical protein
MGRTGVSQSMQVHTVIRSALRLRLALSLPVRLWSVPATRGYTANTKHIRFSTCRLLVLLQLLLLLLLLCLDLGTSFCESSPFLRTEVMAFLSRFVLALAAWDCVGRATALSVLYDNRSFIFDGEREFLLSGSVHPARVHPGDWPRVISLAQELGLNTIQVCQCIVDSTVFSRSLPPPPTPTPSPFGARAFASPGLLHVGRLAS